jgi:hypothetical protein
MTRGTILFHDQFRFTDGEIGEKLLIILNTPKDDQPYLICKTTSQCKYFITTEGCHSNKSIYHIKAHKDGFPCDTWVQLHEIFEFSKEELLKAHFVDKTCTVKNCLPDRMIRAILNCIWKSEDISQFHIDLLFPK